MIRLFLMKIISVQGNKMTHISRYIHSTKSTGDNQKAAKVAFSEFIDKQTRYASTSEEMALYF